MTTAQLAPLEPAARVGQIRDELVADINVLLAGQPLDLRYCAVGTLARIRADLIHARQPAVKGFASTIC